VALSDLEVFSEFLYTAITEILDQEIDKFNAASQGTIVLENAAHLGDYSDMVSYKKLSGLVKRRNAYGSGAQTALDLEQLLDTMVKIAAGTKPVNIDPGQFRWIQRAPEEAAAVISQQLTGDMLADMLNTGIITGRAALSQVAEVVQDSTSGNLTPSALLMGAAKFGDRSNAVRAWIVHSKPIHDYYAGNLANAERLFTYETVNVLRDAFGKLFVVTDSPSLVEADAIGGNTARYSTLGLTEGGIMVHRNNDFESNVETKNGNENILRTFQAEWSFNAGVKGFSWDKSNGGKSPNDAALATATNWDKYATSNKDIAGVIVQTR